MEMASTTSLLALFVASLLYLLYRRRESAAKNLPPGPKGWKALWTFVQAGRNGTLVDLIVEWAKQYGDLALCDLPLFGRRLLISSAQATRELFASKATEDLTNDRIQLFVGKFFMDAKNITLQSPSSHSWSKQRKLLHSTVKFYGDGVARFESTVHQELERVVTLLEKSGGQDVILRDIVEHSVINIIVILLTGQPCDANPDLNNAVAEVNSAIVHLLSPSFSILTMKFPFLVRVPGTWFQQVWRSGLAKRDKYMKFFFDDIKASWTPGSPRGMVDLFLDDQKKEGREWLTDNHIKGLVLDIASGGVSTTTGTLSALFLFLLHHPHVTAKIQEEVDRVFGPRKPELDDRARCGYTEAAILEAMRLHTMFPLGVGHYTRDDVQYRGFTIPKETHVSSLYWAMNRSEEVWGDPESYRPERFLDDSGELLEASHPVRQQLLNFGVGKRSCPGEVFARARIFLYATTLLQRFDILPPKTEKLLPLCKESWYTGAFRFAKPYFCVFRERELSK